MLERQSLDLAVDYVAASNAHNVGEIADMLAPDAVYHSDRAGDHQGKESICHMMEGFFAEFPDVHWDVRDYILDGENGVTFQFFMTATEARSGQHIERQGMERIFFSFARKIARIDVKS